MPVSVERPPVLRQWSLRSELAAVGIGLAVVLAAVYSEPLWGDVHSRFPPLSAVPEAAWGPGLPIAVAVGGLAIAYAPRLAAVLPWRRLLWVSWAAGLIWGLSLALVRGWTGGILAPLTNPAEYLADVDRAGNMGPLLSGFAEHIVYSDPLHWTTQVAGHPPLPFLFYVGLDRIGLGGPTWAALLTIVIGSSAIVAVLVTLRALGDEVTARRAAPFLALTPAVIWIVVSADGIFMALSAWSIALGALALAHRGRRQGVVLALAAGVGLGATLFMSYGLVLLLPVAAVVVVLGRSWWALLPAAVGAGAVTLGFAVAGFWWFDGQSAVLTRYYEGIGALRPYSYWVWANLAILAIAVGPAILGGIGAATHRFRQVGSRLPPACWLAAGAVVGMLLATLSGLSKSEVERIWLPFLIWLIPLAAMTAPSRHRWWLAGQIVTAGTIAIALDTSW